MKDERARAYEAYKILERLLKETDTGPNDETTLIPGENYDPPHIVECPA